MVIIGGGRVGSVLASGGLRVIHRDEAVPDQAPMVVCTQVAHLAQTIERTPASARAGLVFVQNGAFAPILHAFGLHDATCGVLWFAAPGGGVWVTNRPSAFCGQHAEALVALFGRLGIPAEVLSRPDYQQAWAEKMLWSAIFGLLGERDQLGARALARGQAEVHALVSELAPALGLTLDPAAVAERLCAYSHAIGEFPVRLRDVPYRNGWVIGSARARGLATPLHDEAARQIGSPEALTLL